VIKSISERGGKNVYILRTLDGELFLNTIQTPFSEVTALLSQLSDYFIGEYIHQHRYASDIYF
jgi:hypothetical protein